MSLKTRGGSGENVLMTGGENHRETKSHQFFLTGFIRHENPQKCDIMSQFTPNLKQGLDLMAGKQCWGSYFSEKKNIIL